MKVKVKKLTDRALLPVYASSDSAGADIFCALETQADILPGETLLVPTGIALEIPRGYGGFLYARSGLATKKGLAPANKVGVIDADYRGEVKVALYNQSGKTQTIFPGDRIAQLVIAPFLKAEFSEENDLGETARGAGGFGSTGR